MKLFDKVLFTYTLLFSGIVFASNVTRISTTATAIPVLLYLPVLIYLGYECLILYYRKRYAPHNPELKKLEESLNTKKGFSLIRFFRQGGLSFSLSLILFMLCLVTFVSKAFLTSQTKHEFISPLPSNSTLQSYSNR